MSRVIRSCTLRIALASSERYAGCIIDSLTRSGHEVAAVISPSQGIYERHFRSNRYLIHEMKGWDMLGACKRLDIDFRVSRHLEDGSLKSFLRPKNIDLLVLFGWPTMVKEETLQEFPLGGLNIHPSALPLLRGADPIFELVDQYTQGAGVTFHRVTPELDAGPIFLQVNLPHNRLDTYDDLYINVLNAIHANLPLALKRMSENPEGNPQQGEPTVAGRFKQSMRLLDPSDNLRSIQARTRACFSHHTRLTSVGDYLIHFSRCRIMENLEPRYREKGLVQRAEPFGFIVWLDNHCVRLGSARIHGKPWWTMPFYLPRICTPGSRLGTIEETENLAKLYEL